MPVVPTPLPPPGPDFEGLSYVTLAEAEEYFSWSLNSAEWDGASNDYKGRALVTATRRIDRLNFAGLRTSDWNRFKSSRISAASGLGPMVLAPASDTPAPGQPFEFPRNGSDTIPEDIKNACCEIALALLAGVDPEEEMRGLGLLAQRFAAASATFDPAAARMAIRHGIPSYTAWNLLAPYLADPNEINLTRVS